MYDYLKPIKDDLPMRSSGAWAKAKLDYLNRYIDVFETSMRNKWSKRNFIDLQAGPGKNYVNNTSEVFLGSPLLALTTKYPFTGYYFAEMKNSNVIALATRCNASEQRQHIKIYEGDCNVLVDDIVSELKRDERESLNLAFLDPEGLELHWSTVARLASIRRMDLIINYPKSGIVRNMAIAHATDNETPVDKFFGDREWREIYRDAPKRSRHRHLLDLYKGKLSALGYKEIRNSDEFGDEPLMRNDKKAPLYHLIFASKSDLGHKFWHEVTRRDVFGQKRLFDSF